MIETAFVLSIFTGPLLTPVKLARVLPCEWQSKPALMRPLPPRYPYLHSQNRDPGSAV